MADVPIIIDDQEYNLPAGANLVDAAKSIGNEIPVFCYHPKLEPVGMCRMCLVEMGTVEKDRATGEVLRDAQGRPKVRWMPKLQTACTTAVSAGLVIRTNTPQVVDARKDVLEFLLTSHPLDCPVCDKGGECALQDLTMAHGPGVSRMYFSDKMRLDKNVPLGDLIVLDEERCIQCARCIRFQGEIAGDDVLAFHERGRTLQIISISDPPFDTYFSGNTTDVCPVGALTTVDFRFGARPWELTSVPSICPHDAAGSNITLDTRLERDFGGQAAIKRVMPRQNEYVNEIWISDKTRFGHHFSHSADRLEAPRVGSAPAAWADALAEAAGLLNAAGGSVAAIAGSGMSNEDLWALRQLVTGLGGERLGAWPPTHAGADLVAQVGVGQGTNLSHLGQGDAVLIIATDLEEEVPIWRLRLKQAHDRGAYVVVANARPTRMDDFASAALRYAPGAAAHFMHALRQDNAAVAEKLAGAANLVIVAGAEGLALDGSRALMQAAANFLIESGHTGRADSGLLAPFPGPNGMGLHYMGFAPETTLDIAQNPPDVLIVAQADLLLDDPAAAEWLRGVRTIISLTLFEDGLSALAAVALPIQSFAERDGSYTSGERRVQRFYTAQGPVGSALPAWQALGRLAEALGQRRAWLAAAAVMHDLSQHVPAFADITFQALAHTEAQLPTIGDNAYYGGTAYQNNGGLGVQIATSADQGAAPAPGAVTLPAAVRLAPGQLLLLPVTRLYNRERTFAASALMHGRTPAPYAELNPADAQRLKISAGDTIAVAVDGLPVAHVRAVISAGAPERALVLPRHLTAVPVALAPAAAEVSLAGALIIEG